MNLEELFEEIMKIENIKDKTIEECIDEINMATEKINPISKATL